MYQINNLNTRKTYIANLVSQKIRSLNMVIKFTKKILNIL